MANDHPVAGWKPGQSGNPKGAPPDDRSWAGLMRKKCQEIDPKTGKYWKDIVLDSAFEQMAEGDFQHFKHLVDRMDGLQKQSVEIESRTISILPPKEPGNLDGMDEKLDRFDPCSLDGETLVDTSEGEIENDESD
jgi:hypothetical protein